MPRNCSGFTLLEVLVVIALVVLLFLVASERLFPLLGDAEDARPVNALVSPAWGLSASTPLHA